MGFKGGKCPHRPHLFIKQSAWNRGVIDSFYIFPPRKAWRTQCTLARWHKQQGNPRAQKIRCTCTFNCLCKLHLSSNCATAMELKGSTTCRNLKTLEAIQRILLTNNKKNKHASVFSLSSAKHIILRLLAQSQRRLQSPTLFQVYSQWQHYALLQQMPGDDIKAHTHVWAQFWSSTWLLNLFLSSLIRNNYLQLKDCKKLPHVTNPTCYPQRSSLETLTRKRIPAAGYQMIFSFQFDFDNNQKSQK